MDVVEQFLAHALVSGLVPGSMSNNDFASTPSAVGILQCLRLLAEEAASLHLFRTLSAIEDAVEAAVHESGIDHAEQADETVPRLLH